MEKFNVLNALVAPKGGDKPVMVAEAIGRHFF